MTAYRKTLVIGALIGLAAGGVALAQGGATFLESGYLTLVDVVLPAPIPQEARGIADREVHKLTRALNGTPRWTMAIADLPGDSASMMRDFACATRIGMTPATAPKTAALLERASRDTVREANELRTYYKRRRPYLLDSGETCEPQSDQLNFSYDYPAADAARGWTWALVLAEVLHERAAPVLARGRAYGESRIVCGTHSMSAVEAGRSVADATMAVVRTEQAYADAVIAVRAELTALRRTAAPLSPQVCSAEEGVVNQPLFR